MKSVFQLRKVTLPPKVRASLAELVSHLVAARNAAVTLDAKASKLESKRVTLAAEIEQLDTTISHKDGDGIRKLLLQRERLSLIEREIAKLLDQPSSPLLGTRGDLMALGREFAAGLKPWLEQVEADFAQILTPLYNGNLHNAKAALQQAPLFFDLAQAAVVNPRTHWGSGEANYMFQFDRAVELVQRVLDGEIPWSVDTTPAPSAAPAKSKRAKK